MDSIIRYSFVVCIFLVTIAIDACLSSVVVVCIVVVLPGQRLVQLSYQENADEQLPSSGFDGMSAVIARRILIQF